MTAPLQRARSEMTIAELLAEAGRIVAEINQVNDRLAQAITEGIDHA